MSHALTTWQFSSPLIRGGGCEDGVNLLFVLSHNLNSSQFITHLYSIFFRSKYYNTMSTNNIAIGLEAALKSIQLRYRRENNSFIFRVDGQRHVVSCIRDGIQILVSSGRKVAKEKLATVLEFACLVNDKLDSGCLVIDASTMEVRWRASITLVPGANLRLMFVDRFVEVMQVFPAISRGIVEVLDGVSARDAMSFLTDLNNSGHLAMRA